MTAVRVPSRRLAGVLFSAALAMGLATLPAHAADGDWPRWRGPAFDGKSTETGLLKEWPKDGPPLAWKSTDVGAGFSSVAVADGKIYTMGEMGDSSFVVALDLQGKKLWSAKVGKTGGGGGYPGPRCTPTVDTQHIYAVGQYGDLVCLQAANGAEVWRKNLNTDFGGKMMSGWGNSESPLVDGDRLIVTPGGKKGTVAALNKLTGETIWQSDDWTDAAAYTGVIAGTIGGKKQYVQFTAAAVAGLNPETGDVLWKTEREGRTAVIPTPIIHNDHVYVTSGYGVGCDLFKVTADGAGFKVDKVYSNKDMVNHHGGVILHEGKLYGFSDGKGWICQDFLTGNTLWKTKEELGKGTISFADGMLYIRDENKAKGTIALIEASPEGYKEHGRFAPPALSGKMQWAHLVIAGGKLYVRDQETLYCYDIKKK